MSQFICVSCSNAINRVYEVNVLQIEDISEIHVSVCSPHYQAQGLL